MEERFPDIDWFCDNCGAYLNQQRNFNDRKYIWKCTKCGYKNSISSANIRYVESVFVRVMGYLLGIMRSALIYGSLILLIAEMYAKLQPLYLWNCRMSLLCCGLYPVVMVFSLFFERGIAKYGIRKKLGRWIVAAIPSNICGDLARPLQEVLLFPFSMIRIVGLKRKGIVFKKYLEKKCFYATTYFVLLCLLVTLMYVSGLLLFLSQL